MIDFVLAGGAVVAAVVLLRWFVRLWLGDPTGSGMLRMATASPLSSPAKLIDGVHDIPVALSLHGGRVRYENAELDASIDVHDIDEIEYGSDLMTGGIAAGALLRLRSHGRAFEFVLDVTAAERWSRRLPPHGLERAASAG